MARLHALSALDVPPAEHAVAATTDQHHAGRTPRERIHDLAQFAQRVQELSPVGSAAGTPDEELSTASTSATTGQVRSIWTPRHTADRGWLPTAHPPANACVHFPHLHLLLIAPTGQKPAIWTPLYAEEGGVEVVGAAQGLHNGFCGRVPHLNSIV